MTKKISFFLWFLLVCIKNLTAFVAISIYDILYDVKYTIYNLYELIVWDCESIILVIIIIIRV